MSKDAVGDWSATAADNTDIGGVALGEGVMLPSQVNNAFRELMAQVATAIAAGDFVSFPLSPASASSAGYIDFLEDTDNGTNYVRLIGPASVATSDKTQTLIDATGLVAVIPADPDADRLIFWDDSESKPNYATVTPNVVFSTTSLRVYETWAVALSDETTAITTGTKAYFAIPYAFTVVGVAASLNTASSSGTPTFDINEAGTTILSTRIVIDANEKTGGSSGYQGTAAAAAVISDSSIAAFAEISVDIDVAGTGAKGAKVYLIGYPT